MAAREKQPPQGLLYEENPAVITRFSSAPRCKRRSWQDANLNTSKTARRVSAGRFIFSSVAAEGYQPNRDRKIGLRRGKL